jgi:hypothetical protein
MREFMPLVLVMVAMAPFAAIYLVSELEVMPSTLLPKYVDKISVNNSITKSIIISSFIVYFI